MLNYEEFKEYVVSTIRSYLPGDMQDLNYTINSVQKNNGTRRSALLVHDPATDMAPNIYLEPYFQEYQGGKSINSVMEKIAQVCVEQSPRTLDSRKLAVNFNSFESVKDHIVVALVNAEKNRSLLSRAPHTMKEDLAMIYKVHVNMGKDYQGTVTIENDHMRNWSVSKEEIHAAAMENSQKILPAVCKPMGQIMAELMIEQGMPEEIALRAAEETIDSSMFVITNKDKLQGAAAIYYSDSLEQLSQQLGENLIVLPSSIHECIVVPESAGDIEEFAEMVKSINEQEVSAEEQLSDHVYRYDASSKTLSLADTTVEEIQKVADRQGSIRKENRNLKEKLKRTKEAAGKIRLIFGLLVILTGADVFFYPEIRTCYLKYRTNQLIGEFDRQNGTESRKEIEPESGNVSGQEEIIWESKNDQTEGGEETGQSGTEQSEEKKDTSLIIRENDLHGSLLEEIHAYNREIYENGQADFRDAWSVTQSPGILAPLKNQMFGYITVPVMDVTLPLFIGASEENMAKGAAVLGATSIPVGGKNTNCVVAGHRGYRGAPYFLNIEQMKEGDAVYITNPWENLLYRVESIDIILPTDSDKVKIQEGKDMVTLLSCHPYRSHGRYRYAVYCVRDEEFDGIIPQNGAEKKNPDETEIREPEQDNMVSENLPQAIEASDGTLYESSEADICRERLCRRAGAGIILLILLITMIRMRKTDSK